MKNFMKNELNLRLKREKEHWMEEWSIEQQISFSLSEIKSLNAREPVAYAYSLILDYNEIERKY